MKRLPVLLITIATYVAFGTLVEASDSRAMKLTYQPWAKICINRPDGNSDCFTSSGAKGACQPSGGGIAIWIRDGKQRSLSINLVTKRMLDDTLAVRIDQGTLIPVPDPVCQEQGCRGKLDIDTTFIEGLKHSRTIGIEAMTRDHQAVSLAFPLAGFTEAFDGPAGGAPKVAEMTGDELKERMKRTENPPPCEE
ncbi:MAG: invasion associated locus B family protein [Bradyrhizobium sp.]